MKALLVLIAVVLMAFLFNQAWSHDEKYIEFTSETKKLCEDNGGCIVVPRSFLLRMKESLVEQEELIVKLHSLLGKSCA